MIAERPLFGLGRDMVESRYPLYRHPTAPRLTSPAPAQQLPAAGRRARAAGAGRLRGRPAGAALRRAWRRYRARGRRRGHARRSAPGRRCCAVRLSLAALFEHNWGDTEVQRWVLFLHGGSVLRRHCRRGPSPTEPRREPSSPILAALRPRGGARRSTACCRPPSTPPARLHAAMRYSVFAGGKRLRPALVVLAGETFGAPRALLLPRGGGAGDDPHLQPGPRRPAGARRRRSAARPADRAPGSSTRRPRSSPATRCSTLRPALLAREPRGRAAGGARARGRAGRPRRSAPAGMIGGQVADLEAERAGPTIPRARSSASIARKTGALLDGGGLGSAALYAGAGEADDAAARRLGAALGLLFQIGDDILDVVGEPSELGKTRGQGRRGAQAHLSRPLRHRESRAPAACGWRAEALELAAELPAAARTRCAHSIRWRESATGDSVDDDAAEREAPPSPRSRMRPAKTMRLDQLLVERGLFASREQARRAVMAGAVEVDGQRVDKPGTAVARRRAARGRRRRASRSSRAPAASSPRRSTTSPSTPRGCVCLDVGASTGGFTDCLLQRGALRVYALDVGYGQLDSQAARRSARRGDRARQRAPPRAPTLPSRCGLIDRRRLVHLAAQGGAGAAAAPRARRPTCWR